MSALGGGETAVLIPPRSPPSSPLGLLSPPSLLPSQSPPPRARPSSPLLFPPSFLPTPSPPPSPSLPPSPAPPPLPPSPSGSGREASPSLSPPDSDLPPASPPPLRPGSLPQPLSARPDVAGWPPTVAVVRGVGGRHMAELLGGWWGERRVSLREGAGRMRRVRRGRGRRRSVCVG